MDSKELKIETIGILIDAYYTDAEIVSVLDIDIEIVKSIRARHYRFMSEYAE
jgi:hypothetical protein